MKQSKAVKEALIKIELSEGARDSVLVIEPDPNHQWKLARMLTLKGYRAIGTSSCDGAIALLKEYPVGLVLLAENLPTISLTTLIEKIRESRPFVHVVVMRDTESTIAVKPLHPSRVYEFPKKQLRMETLTGILADMDPSAA
jgi:DNA-binding NtrC family response regulator